MRNPQRASLVLALVLTVTVVPVVLLARVAGAQTQKWAPPPSDPLAVELFKLGHDKKTHFVESSTKATWGRAEIYVDAPLAVVRSAVVDYASWSSAIPRFEKVKVVGTDASGNTEVYLRMPILKGAAKIWAVERFAPPVTDGAGEKVVGAFVKGNVDDLRATWRYRPIDAMHTVLTLEIWVDPKVSVADALMITQLEDAGGEGCLGLRDRAVALAKKPAKKP